MEASFEIASYREEGFVVLPEGVPQADIDLFLSSPRSPLPTEHEQPTLQRHRNDPLWAFMTGHPRLLPAVAMALGGRPHIVQSMYIPKPPAAPGIPKNGVALHRDQYYIRADPPKVAVCWIAMSDTDAGNGGLRVVPGSHRWPLELGAPGRQPLGADELRFRARGGEEWWEPTVGARFDHLGAGEVVTLTVPRGGVVIFDGLLVHGSGTNPSTSRERLAFATHYVPAGAWVCRADLHDTVAADGRLAQEGERIFLQSRERP